MLESLYTGLTGLDTYAKGLNVISHNVANLNTPGFKRTQLQFADLYYHDAGAGLGSDTARHQIGAGVGSAGSSLNFAQGESRQTGGDLDLLIEGPGFFVLRQGGEQFYTRAGQFQFDAEGFLVDKSSGSRVAALGEAGQLEDISLQGLRTHPPQATTRLSFSGNLSPAAAQHAIGSVSVFDAQGGSTTLQLSFENTNAITPGSWKLSVSDAQGKLVGSGELRFLGGAPQPGFDSLRVSFASAGGVPASALLDFSSEVTAFSSGSTSTLALASQDGRGAGWLVQSSVDAEGYLNTRYSNGQTVRQSRLALAWFANPDTLQAQGSNRFQARSGEAPQLGHAGERMFGQLTAGSIEASNVDLSQQFSEMIITQRGFQASSQLITTSNEMIQQLMELRGKR